MLPVGSGLFSLRPVALRAPRCLAALRTYFVTRQVFSTLAPSMGFSPAEFVLVVGRTPLGLPCPSFFSSLRLKLWADVAVPIAVRTGCRLARAIGNGVRMRVGSFTARFYPDGSLPKQRRSLPQVSHCLHRHFCQFYRCCHQSLANISAGLRQRWGTRDVALVSPAQVSKTLGIAAS